MRQRSLVFFVLALVFSLTIAGCGRQEKEAKAELSKAVALEQGGNLVEAEALIQEILQRFPQTEAATQAKALAQKVAVRKQEVSSELAGLLERMVQVVQGYKAMYGSYPVAIEDLDREDYFFDSGYLAEMIPAELDVYLLLDGSSEDYRFWVFNPQAQLGLTVQGGQADQELFSGAEAVATLASQYRAADRIGQLTPLYPAQDAPRG